MPVQANERQTPSARTAPYPAAGPSCPRSPRKLRLLATAASHNESTHESTPSDIVHAYTVLGNEGVLDLALLSMPLNEDMLDVPGQPHLAPSSHGHGLSPNFMGGKLPSSLRLAISSDSPSSLSTLTPPARDNIQTMPILPVDAGNVSLMPKVRPNFGRTNGRVFKARKIVDVRRPNGTMTRKSLEIPTLQPAINEPATTDLPSIPDSVTPSQIQFYEDARRGYTSKGDSLPYYQVRSPLAYASVDEARSGFPFLPSQSTVAAKDRKIPDPQPHLRRLKAIGIKRRRANSSKSTAAESVGMSFKRWTAKKIRSIIRQDPELMVLRRTEMSLSRLYRSQKQAQDPTFMDRAVSFNRIIPEPVGQAKEWMEDDSESEDEDEQSINDEGKEEEAARTPATADPLDTEADEERTEPDSDEDEWVSDADSEEDEDEDDDADFDVELDPTSSEMDPSSSATFRHDVDHLRFLVDNSQAARDFNAVRLERIEKENRKLATDWSGTYQRKEAEEERKRRMEAWLLSTSTSS